MAADDITASPTSTCALEDGVVDQPPRAVNKEIKRRTSVGGVPNSAALQRLAVAYTALGEAMVRERLLTPSLEQQSPETPPAQDS